MTCPRFLLTGSVGMGLAVAAGCTSSVNGTTSGTGGDTDVTGTTQTTYLTDTGDITGVPMASFTAAALVPAPGGGFDRVAGAYDAAEGTFVLHGVPEEPYYLETGAGSFVWTTARTFDLDQVLAGRPDAQTVTTSPTNLVIDASAMTPWQDGDELALF